MPSILSRIVRGLLPVAARRRVRRATRWPPVGSVDLGDLAREQPFSRAWGFDRGQPVDRHFIERFLESESGAVRGRVLEVADDAYTRRFGGDRVERSDVLHVTTGHPKATVVGDLATGDGIPEAAFDCVICTQTLQLVPDHESAIRTLHRVLAPGGTLLLTIPGISQISRDDMDQWGDYWRYTTASALRLFGPVFGEQNVVVRAHGNMIAAVAFLAGLAVEDVGEERLAPDDPDYQLLITVRADRSRA